jgi:hypothetical protein
MVTSAQPLAEMVCGNGGCPAHGVVRRVMLRTPAPGLVEMPGALLCTGCGFQVAMVRMWEPHGSGAEDSMAKITAHGGPTNAAAGPGEPGFMPSSADPDPVADLIPNHVAPPGHIDVTPFGSVEPVYVAERPSTRDPKGVWVAYAVGLGLPRDTAEGMTKQELADWKPEVFARAEAAEAQATAEGL